MTTNIIVKTWFQLPFHTASTLGKVLILDQQAYIDWCNFNLYTDDWYIEGIYFPIIYFKNEIDLLAFKLKFGL
jgi:hypothetical protein